MSSTPNKTISTTLKQGLFNTKAISFILEQQPTIIMGDSGSGKTILLIEMMYQWLIKGHKVTYIGAAAQTSVPNCYIDSNGLKTLKYNFPATFQCYDVDCYVNEITSNDTIIVIEELELVGKENKWEDIQSLISHAKKAFISFQHPTELKRIPFQIIQKHEQAIDFILMKLHPENIESIARLHKGLSSLRKINKLPNSYPFKYSEFLVIQNNTPRILRLPLKYHSLSQ